MPELDGVRACSILLVLAAHMLPLGPKLLALNAAAGKMGMSLFFCLSGFLITRFLMENQDITAFLVKRVSRIVPALFLYLAILVAVVDLPLENVLLNALFLSNYLVEGLQVGPTSHLWSLCVEMHFYLAIAGVVLLLGRAGLLLIPIACMAITALRVSEGVHANINTHLRGDEILIGGCIALAMPLLAERPHFGAWLRRHARWTISLVALVWFASAHEAGGPLNYLRPYFAGALVSLAIIGGWQTLSAFLRHRVMAYLAKISYALYIFHPLTIYGPMNEGSTAERYLLKRPVSFVLTFLAAHISTVYWERLWSRAARGYLARRAARAPTTAAARG